MHATARSFIAVGVLSTWMPITAADSSEKGHIHVHVNGLRNDRGQVLCALFSSENAFPTKPDHAVDRVRSPIDAGNATCDFLRVAPGTYAVSVTHDENSNGRLDRSLLGIPVEGVGASNNARGRMGPPKFKAAAIQFDGTALELTITVNYLI
jgi:uncharacterized protein (DUF2141 family)